MNEFYIALSVLGILVITLGFFSISIERFPFLSRPIIALGLGVLIGPSGLNWLGSPQWVKHYDKILEAAAMLTMAIALMGVALRLPRRYFLENCRSMAMMLCVIMPFMWISSGILIYFILGWPFWVAMLAGAVITPTDPVLSTTVVHGKFAEEKIPERIRHALSAESGANDGLAYPLVFLPLLILTRSNEHFLSEWLIRVLLWEVGGAIVLGGILGLFVGRIMVICEKKKTMEKTSLLAVTLALSLFTLGAGELIHINSILAVFAVGIGFDNAATIDERIEEEKIQESMNQFFTVPIFALYGMFIPWGEWIQLGWRALVLIVAVLFLRRLPFFLLFQKGIPVFTGKKDAAFTGWFGPIGVAAILYSIRAENKTGLHEIWIIGSLIVFVSVITHGLTGTPLTRIYSKLNSKYAL